MTRVGGVGKRLLCEDPLPPPCDGPPPGAMSDVACAQCPTWPMSEPSHCSVAVLGPTWPERLEVTGLQPRESLFTHRPWVSTAVSLYVERGAEKPEAGRFLPFVLENSEATCHTCHGLRACPSGVCVVSLLSQAARFSAEAHTAVLVFGAALSQHVTILSFANGSQASAGVGPAGTGGCWWLSDIPGVFVSSCARSGC